MSGEIPNNKDNPELAIGGLKAQQNVQQRRDDEASKIRFENKLKTLEVRVPNTQGGTYEASPVVRGFTEEVLRGIADAGEPKNMDNILSTALEAVSRESKDLPKAKDIATMSPEDARTVAVKAAVDWARKMGVEPYSDDPLSKKGLEIEARLSLRADQKEISPENIKEEVRKKLKERLGALSFYRGGVSETGVLSKLDEQLRGYGFLPNYAAEGYQGYYDDRDTVEARDKGNKSFLEGKGITEKIKEEVRKKEEVEKQKIEERKRAVEAAEAAAGAEKRAPIEAALVEADKERKDLERNLSLEKNKLAELEAKATGFMGMLRGIIGNPQADITRQKEKIFNEELKLKKKENDVANLKKGTK